ncbi:hypothetical protein LCGC14_1072370 [marine sediment metagenome]|uniref:Uncharacterized protein n=1 Tax=marine sediment metagenome TaxID=412755 RepID=A0A0F9MHS2_9ZZZZ
MTVSEDSLLVNFICPYCKTSFSKRIDYQKKSGLFSLLIKNHPEGDSCSPFIAYIDTNGRHRGSQKIDNIEGDISENVQFLGSAQETINELDKTIGFYHLKVPRKQGRGFEHKVASVKARAFMSSTFYVKLITYLVENEAVNTFGTITIEEDSGFEAGVLMFGKYLEMAFTLFWKDQKSILSKTIEELKAYALLTIEKLLDLYDLMDFFF